MDVRLKAMKVIGDYRDDIVLFVREQFHVEPDAWQKKALVAFTDMDKKIFRLSLQACAGPGKSALLAWCGWWFLCTQGEKGNHPKGAAISITQDNLKDNLWAELSKWQQVSPLCSKLFTWTKQRIFSKDHPETWFLSARSFSKTANSEEQGRVLSGVHSKYVLFLIDESGDIPPNVLKSVEQAFSTADKVFGRVIQAGNPTSHEGMLFAAQGALSDKWHVVKITGDPDDPDRSPRIDAEWAKSQIDQYGKDDPWIMSYILGMFPSTSINALLTPVEVEDAMRRKAAHDDYYFSQKRLGVDVARFGSDSTVIFPRQGLMAFPPAEMRGARTHDIIARIAAAKMKWTSEVEFVDGTGGYGAGVVDGLLQTGHTPQEINFASKALSPKFYNKRAEMWWNMADWIKRGGCIPKHDKLARELIAVTYTHKNGKLIIESKDQIKEKLGYSTDFADALCLTFAMDERPASNTIEGYDLQFSPKIKSEYDPFDDERF